MQVGQFESGIEIDDDLGRIWFTRNGGGNWGESYDLALYFFARHTAHDHFDKRHKKGYLFIIGDEPYFVTCEADEIKKVIGDDIEGDLKIQQIVAEVKKKYHLYYIVPALTNHFDNRDLEGKWKSLLGEEHFIKLQDPQEICPLLASLVALNEGHATLDNFTEDGISAAVTNALVIAAKVKVGKAEMSGSLPPIAGARGGVERL